MVSPALTFSKPCLGAQKTQTAGVTGALGSESPEPAERVHMRGAHPWEAALLVKEVQDPERLLLDQVQDVLVVDEGDVGPVDLLALILGLLHLEHVLVEVLLQLLVCQVDAELLEVVLPKGLEPCVACKGEATGLRAAAASRSPG